MRSTFMRIVAATKAMFGFGVSNRHALTAAAATIPFPTNLADDFDQVYSGRPVRRQARRNDSLKQAVAGRRANVRRMMARKRGRLHRALLRECARTRQSMSWLKQDVRETHALLRAA